MIVRGRGLAYGLERLTLFVTLFAIMFPLRLNLGFFGIALFELPLAFLISMWAIRKSVQQSACSDNTKWEVIVIALVGWLALSTILHAPDEMAGLSIWAGAFLLAFYAHRNWGRVFDFRFVVRFAFAALSLQLSVGLYQLMTGTKVGNIQDYFGQLADPQQPRVLFERIVGTVGQGNLFGNWLVTLLPIVSVYFLSPKLDSRLVVRSYAITLAALSAVCLAFNITRTNAVIVLLVLLMQWVILRLRPGPRCAARAAFGKARALKMVVSSLLAVVALLVILDVLKDRLYVLPGAIIDRLARTEGHLMLRLEQYRGAVESIAANPLLGVGFGNSDSIWDTVNVDLPREFTSAPHNVYLILAVEGGMPALILFALLLAAPMRRYMSLGPGSDPFLDGVALSMVAFILIFTTYVVPIGHALWPLFAFLLGTLHAAARDPEVVDVAASRASSSLKRSMPSSQPGAKTPDTVSE